MKKIVVGLSTIPSRFNKLKSTLDSLHNQSRKPDKIYLHISDYYRRFKIQTNLKSLPPYLSEYNLLSVKIGEDYGPISKLFVSLQNEPDNNTIIVTCDDDMIYGEHWLENIEKHSNRLPNCAVGYRGRIFGKDLNYKNTQCIISKNLTQDAEVDIVTAVRGWAYPKKLFDNNYISRWQKTKDTHPFIFFNDDIWISGTLAEINIKKIVFNNTPFCSSVRHLENSLLKLKDQNEKTNMHLQLFKNSWNKSAR